MQNFFVSYNKKLDKVYTLQFKKSAKYWKKRSIPRGQILYHKKNFSKYFGLQIKDFKNKKVLETGAGPGMHAIILAFMSAEVHAADILKSNVLIIKTFLKLSCSSIFLKIFKK